MTEPQTPNWSARVRGRPPEGTPRIGLVPLQLKVSQGFKIAFKNFAIEQSNTAGIEVGMNNIVETTIMQAYPELAKEAQNINKELSNGKKSLDGIKRN